MAAAAACLRVFAAALLLSAPAAAAAEAAGSPAGPAAAQPPRTRTAARPPLPLDGPGPVAQAFAPLRQLAASFLGLRGGPAGHGLTVADLGNITVLQASGGCLACCGAGDCSRAYMDSSIGMCCVSNPPTCCPSGSSCTATGCAQSTWGSRTGSDEPPSLKTLLAGVVGLALACGCLLCLMNACGCCGPSRPMAYGVPAVGYASPVMGYGGAPAYGYPQQQYMQPAPVYGGGYGYPGGYGGGYGGGYRPTTGTDVALAGGGGFLGGLGLGYLLGEASQPDTQINYYGGGGDGGQQWIPADGGGGGDGGGWMPADR